jgi:hypothetical protein
VASLPARGGCRLLVRLDVGAPVRALPRAHSVRGAVLFGRPITRGCATAGSAPTPPCFATWLAVSPRGCISPARARTCTMEIDYATVTYHGCTAAARGQACSPPDQGQRDQRASPLPVEVATGR